MKCPFCNSEKIEVGVQVVDPFWGSSAELTLIFQKMHIGFMERFKKEA